jgi:hypothetical protein
LKEQRPKPDRKQNEIKSWGTILEKKKIN